MPIWAWIIIALIFLLVACFFFCFMIAVGDYNKRCEEDEYKKRMDYERRVREQQRKKEEQNWIPEQKRDDSTWF